MHAVAIELSDPAEMHLSLQTCTERRRETGERGVRERHTSSKTDRRIMRTDERQEKYKKNTYIVSVGGAINLFGCTAWSLAAIISA